MTDQFLVHDAGCWSRSVELGVFENQPELVSNTIQGPLTAVIS